jgi:hypothetical protein
MKLDQWTRSELIDVANTHADEAIDQAHNRGGVERSIQDYLENLHDFMRDHGVDHDADIKDAMENAYEQRLAEYGYRLERRPDIAAICEEKRK